MQQLTDKVVTCQMMLEDLTSWSLRLEEFRIWWWRPIGGHVTEECIDCYIRRDGRHSGDNSSEVRRTHLISEWMLMSMGGSKSLARPTT